MGNKSIRIQTIPGGSDKYLTLKLENDVDFFEVLSLKISQKDIYGTFNSDYGVVIGRVIANGGVGIPNAKISVFIPISDEDKTRPDISAIYPYSSPRDKNIDGVRYNLLPRVAVNNPFLVEGQYSPIVPVGTFNTKEEITTNDTYLEVYEKYYKYTTVTNNSGDYMIFGVPIGIQTVHMSVDVTDVGKYSMTPGTMINQLGYSPNLFTDNGTKVKYSTDLETLPNVETQEVAVEVRPFWGDEENFEIGITRQDFKVRAIIATSFIVFGSAFTDAFSATWGQNDTESGDQDEEMWRMNHDATENVSIASKRIGKINIDVYTINPKISDNEIITGSTNIDTTNDIIKLDKSEYTTILRNGDFILIIPCNRNKIITDEFGNDVLVDSSNPNGVFTNFRGMFFCSYGDELPVPAYGDIAGEKFDGHTFTGQRWKMKIPQSVALTNNELNTINDTWRREHAVFTASTIYSVAKFHPLNFRNSGADSISGNTSLDPFNNVGIIVTDDTYNSDNTSYQFQPNNTDTGGGGSIYSFGKEYMNFCLYFPQHTYFIRNQQADRHGNDQATINPTSRFFYLDNGQKLLGKDFNTKNVLRGDYHKTDFVVVPREDIVNIYNNAQSLKGFRSNQPPFDTNILLGNYKSTGSVKYFYRGIGESDCISYLIENGIVGL